MDVFAPDVGFAAEESNINGQSSLVSSAIPATTLGSTAHYIYDPNGVPRNPQYQRLATSLGLGAVAPYEGGVAVGAYAAALANACTAVGFHARASVYSAVALGDQASALAHRTIAIGRAANAVGVNSIAIGAQAQATGLRGVAVGGGARANGVNTTSLGYLSGSLGESSITLGSISYTTGTGGLSIGTGIQNTHHQSVVIGVNARSTVDNAFVAGSNISSFRDVWFGRGNAVDPNISPTGFWTLHGEESFGFADQPGGVLNLGGGRGTGTGPGGKVNIQVSDPGPAGTALNPLHTRLEITSTAITALAGAGFVGNLQGSFIGLNTPFNVIAINIQHTPLGTLGTTPTIRLHGNGVAYELLNSVASANWHFGLDEAVGNSCVIGAGYGPGQGIPPAIRIAQNNNVTVRDRFTVLANTGGQGILTLNGDVNTARAVEGSVAGVRRWSLLIGNGNPEGSVSDGSNLDLYAFTNAGGVIDLPLQIVRAAGGTISLNRPVNIAGNLNVTGTISVGAFSFVDLTVSGKISFTTAQQVLAASIGGDMVVTQMFMGPSYKAIIVQFRNHLGVSGFTFALPFAAVPMKFEQPTIVSITSLTNAQITFNTGTTLNGWLKLEGF